ncbi:hypothetical protein FRC07_007377 [Ceratobasidium sp. 392]|nr:hypothetical protein FRC07_007377 [Ceratobasidium sp. 392]
MIFVNDKKYACETCIKGHRSSSCQHTERALFEIKKKGRPVTQCDHCRELRKTKQVHVRCSCDSKPDQLPAAPKAPGAKKGSRLPAEAAYPNGLSPGVTGVATSPAPPKHATESCTCGEGETCHCCVPRKAAPKTHAPPAHSSGHTPPPVYASGHSPNNPHQHPHQHHLHAYAPYTRPAVRLSTDGHSAHLATNSNSNLGLSATNIVPSPGAMYRVGPCACGTTCACPECAHHRQQPHSHQPQQGQPIQGHGGEPCPVRCANCYDCAGGLTLLLDPNAYQSPPYSAESDVASFSAFSGSDPNASVQSFDSEAQAGAYASNGQFPVGSGSEFFSPAMVDASGMDVDMDNAEFTAAMAGLDAGIGASEANANNTTPDASSFWDRPRCGFAVSTERGNGSPGHARIGSEVGSEIGVGSDGGFDLGSELGIGSDDGGSVAGVGSTNLSMDFADLDFGGLQLPPMQQQYPYPDHASQRFSGEYTYGDRHSMHGGRVASTSSQFSNHSNLSLVSSIDSASVSLASLGSSHGISSLASSHHIPSSHGAPLSGRVTPGHSGRMTPVRGVTPNSPQGGKPMPRGYRRILPKVAAMTNHRPFRRLHHSAQPSLHAVMESDAAGGNVTSPPPSQVLLQPQPVQAQQPRVRKSVRSHLPIVGKYFAPGGRYEPSRLRNLNQPQMQQQAQGFRLQGQSVAAGQSSQAQQGPTSFQGQHQQQQPASSSAFQGQPGSSNSAYQSTPPAFQAQAFQQDSSPLQYSSFSSSSQAQVQPPSGFSQSGSGFDQSPVQSEYLQPDDDVIYEEQEPESEVYEVAGPDYGPGGGVVYQDDGMSQFAGAGGDGNASSYVQQVSLSLPAHAQMVAALSHGPTSAMVQSYERSSQSQASHSYSHLPQQQNRPHLSNQQHHSSQSTAMPAIDTAMHSPLPLPPDEPAPPSPQQKVGSGVGMPLTMSLPTTGPRTPGAMLSRTTTQHPYDDTDVDVKVPVKEVSPGPAGRKSRWPSFSVHGHRVMVGAKVMGAAYTSRS